MITPSHNPAFFSALCVKIPGTLDPASRFWRAALILGLLIMLVRTGIFLVSGGPPDVRAIDILTGIMLTVSLAGFLITHSAWSRPSAEKGRYVINKVGVSFNRENRSDDLSPDWELYWTDVSKISAVQDRRGLVIQLVSAAANKEVEVDRLRVENYPEALKALPNPDELPAGVASRLIVRAINHFAEIPIQLGNL